jgi:hypothetical protein
MAKGKGKSEGATALPGYPSDFDFAGDAFSLAAICFSIFISLAILLVFFGGAGASAFLTALRVYVFPWVIVLSLLSIGKEFWAIRVHLKHIHLGNILEGYLDAKSK